MRLMQSIRKTGWVLVAGAAMAGCEDWTRLEVTPDQQSTAATTQTAVTTNAVVATTATTTASAASPAPSGDLGVTGEGGGFLWKPVSESSGTLMILLPPQYTGSIGTVFVASSDGSVIEVGSFVGIFNGGRAHYRFTSSGAAYGSGVYAVADLADGITTHHWYIPNGGTRTEY